MDQSLVTRATEMFGQRRTWCLGGQRYAISSADDQAVWYVDLTFNPPFCTCPQFSYRCRGNAVCKHIVYFWAFGRWHERPDGVVQRRRRGRGEPVASGRGVGVVRDE